MNDLQRLNDFSKMMNPCSLTIPFVEWLVDNGFFTAPASTKYHGAHEGGLYDHSKAVAQSLMKLTEGLKLEWQRPESPLIIGMFHDLCKIDQYREIIDDEGVVMFGCDDAQGRKVHYEYAEPLLKGHGEKSVMLLSQFMTLTPEEMFCIRYHMGAYPKEDMDAFGNAIEKFPNVLYTHTADMMAARILGV